MATVQFQVVLDANQDADVRTLSLPANTTISAFIRTLLDDASAADARVTLELDAAGLRALGFFDITNDGAASGLDADLLDGNHASAFATSAQGATADSALQPAGAATVTNKTIDGDNNTISNLDLGNEVDWPVAADVQDRTAFASGDKMLIQEAGVGLRKIDYDDLPGAGGGLSNVVEDTTPQLGGALDVNGQKIVSVTNGNIDIEPNGTGNVLLGNLTFDADQTVGAGQDNYVLTYDNAGGTIQLEAATGGGVSWSTPVDADVVPDADGTRDLGTTANRFAEVHADQIELAGTTAVSSILDEDTMATDSATALATQQSIKAYVDSNVYDAKHTASRITLTGTINTDISSALGLRYRITGAATLGFTGYTPAANEQKVIPAVIENVSGSQQTVTWAASVDAPTATIAIPNNTVLQFNVTRHIDDTNYIVGYVTSVVIDHDATTNFVADEHVAHGSVSITAGNGLTGGGTIAATRNLAVGAGTGITVNADDVALSTATQDSLALADSSLQPGHNITQLDGTAWRVTYTDGAGDVTELALGASGTVLTSAGATSAPNWATPSVGASDRTEIGVYNDTGATLTQLSAVYFSGWNIGTAEPEVTDARADSESTMPAIGIVAGDINTASSGTLVCFGELAGIDTSTPGWSFGDDLYVDPSTAGNLTNVPPVGSNRIQKVAVVTRVHATQGTIQVFGAGRSNAIPNFTAAEGFWYGGTDGVASQGTFGTGVRTFLQTPSSANLATAVTDETGSGALVFATSPTLVTPVLGTPTSGTLTNCTGYTFANVASTPTTLSGYGITDAAANTVTQGQHTIWIPASAMVPRTTSGAAAGTIELATNDVMFDTLDFDSSADEFAQFSIQMPLSWNEGTLVCQFVWSHPTTATNFNVSWNIQSVAFANDDAGDTAFGGSVESEDTGGTADDVYISGETPAMTVAGTPGAEEWVVFQVWRDVDGVTSNLGVDARLHGVKVHYTTNDDTDD